MQLKPAEWPLESIPIKQLRPDPVTDFALAPVPDKLTESIRQMGLLTPLLACRQSDTVSAFCGHRRLAVAIETGITAVPVRLVNSPLTAEEKLVLQLQDNRVHRSLSDIETGRALIRLSATDFGENEIIENVLPLLDQQPSKKRLHDFLKARDFSKNLQLTLHNLAVPLRTYSMLYPWGDADLSAIQNLLTVLQSGANKCRDLFELIGETADRDAVTPASLISDPAIQTALEDQSLNPGDRYQSIHQHLFQKRYPTLSDLRVEVRRALSQMALDGKVRIRVPEHFESGELKVEFSFHTHAEFIEKAECLFRASDSEALADLLKIVQSPQSHTNKR